MRKAVITFLVKEGKVLLLHSTPPNGKPSYWEGISGFVEPGESSLKAAQREAKEELNIDIAATTLKQCYNFTHREIEFVVFSATDWQGEFSIQEVGIREVRWFPLADLPLSQMHPSDKGWLPRVLLDDLTQ